MKTTFVLLPILLLTFEISSKQGGRKKPKPRKTMTCSAQRPCRSPSRYCVPFFSRCTKGNRMFAKLCYIDAQCADDQICSTFLGFCFRKPKWRKKKPLSFCRKGLCPCPAGFECKGRYPIQQCLSSENGSGEQPTAIVN